MKRTGLLRGGGTPEQRRQAIARQAEKRREAAARWEAKRRRARFQNRNTLRTKRRPAAMSPQRREDEQRRRSAYAIVARRAAGRCEIGTVECTGSHDETHHRLPRSASSVRNEKRHDPELLLAACTDCHEWVEVNRAESYERGWLVRRGETAA